MDGGRRELGEAEAEMVLRAMEGEVSALMRARTVSRLWHRVCAFPGIWTLVRWPMLLPVSDNALLLVMRLSGGCTSNFDFSLPSDDDSFDMLRAPAALSWEWSLENLRGGLSPKTLSRVVAAAGPRLRDLRFSWGGIRAGQVLNAMVSCSSLTRLDLAKSELDNQHLPGLRQVLCQTPHLLHLDLCANELSDGHLLPLEECRQLQWLGLCMNGLEALPPGLSTLTNLTLLLVGSNRLEETPPELRHLRKLVELDLGSNQIPSVPQWISALTALRVLGLRSTSRRHASPAAAADTSVPAIPDLSSLYLEELDLSDCDLWDCHVPAWIVHMHTLTALDLSENHLNSLPLLHGQLPRLERLCLHNQGPWEGDHPLPGSEGAEEMYLLQGGLFRVPPGISGLDCLRKLSLDGTLIGSWPSGPTVPGGEGGEGGEESWGRSSASGRVESAEGRGLTGVKMLQDLQYLSLTGTGLRATPWFVPSMRSLLTLNLSTNSLTVLSPSMAVLTSLTYLSVAHNHLSCVPAFVGTLGQLRELHVAHNHIIAVARSVFELSKLQVLDISMNPIGPRGSPPIGHWAPPGHRGVVHGQDAARLREPQYTCGGKISDPEDGGAPPCNETLHILRNTPPEYQGGIDPAPAACRLTQLEQAVLVDIGLVRLPAWLSSPGATLSLRQLSFGANRRLQQFPPEISILQNLNLLSCSACAMEGAVPDSVVALTQLQWLSLDRNRFTELPAGLALLTSLRRLELHDNRLKLSIAPTVRVMSWLHYLSLHGNPDVTAQVPSQVLMCAYLDRDVLPLLALLATPSWLMSQAPETLR